MLTRNFLRGLVRPSIRERESKSGEMSVLEAFCVCVCVEGGLGGAVGVDGGWLPLPTRPQQYCDPASLVLFLFHSSEK